MVKTIPRILFAAPGSGNGKTTVICGVLRCLQKTGKKVTSFKCGPDYIDTMFHSRILGMKTANLDTYFTDDNTTRYLLAKNTKDMDIAVLEGVMGYYDGLAGISLKASTYDIGKVTGTPVILIVNGRGSSVSLIPLIKGMMEYRTDSNIKGVILNQVGEGIYPELKEMIERELEIPVVGHLPKMEDVFLGSRHLGLLQPHEIHKINDKIEKLSEAVRKNIDMKLLLEIAHKAKEIEYEEPVIPKLSKKVRIGVAKDEAFNFYYADNLDLLKRMGAELEFFSPVHDKVLPKHIHGLLLGGGYPENYGEELEANLSMKGSIKEAITGGMPCLAECGGFLYLQDTLEDISGIHRKMVGVIKGKGFRTEKLQRFGYIELETKEDCVMGKRGEKIKGHEFHYWDSTSNGETFLARKPLRKREYPCICSQARILAGFPHLYYYSNVDMPYQFLSACAQSRQERLNE